MVGCICREKILGDFIMKSGLHDSEANSGHLFLFCLLPVLIHALSGVQFFLLQSFIKNADRFAWQFYMILGFSVVLSLLINLFRSFRLPGLIMKVLCLFLMIYPLTGHPQLSLTLMLPLLLEIGFYVPYPLNGAGLLLVLGVSLFLQKPKSVFYTDLPGPELQDHIFFLTYSLLVIFLILLLSRTSFRLRVEKKLTNRLDDALSAMAKANLGFQTYTNSLELETLNKERKRVSREIHDTVGYSLTNIRIMLEASLLMIEKSPEEAGSLIEKSMKEAGFCLEETRTAMRLLRSKEISRPVGIRAFFKLVSVFADATGIQVKTEFGNSPDSFGSSIDKAVFRFIQEGMTNSFRHGRATQIRIYFWIQNQILHLSIQDNGTGLESMHEGLGITGMKERLDELKGSLYYHNITGGFEVSLSIPLKDKKEKSEVLL